MSHPPAANQVQVQVENRLSTVRAGVDYRPVAILMDTLFACQLCGNNEHMSHEGLISRGKLVERMDVLVGNDQDMDRRSRVEIMESRHLFVAIDDAGRGFTVDNFAKDTVRHIPHPTQDGSNQMPHGAAINDLPERASFHNPIMNSICYNRIANIP